MLCSGLVIALKTTINGQAKQLSSKARLRSANMGLDIPERRTPCRYLTKYYTPKLEFLNGSSRLRKKA
jgi:hypothetical protein